MCICADCNTLLSERLMTRLRIQNSSEARNTYESVKDWTFEELRERLSNNDAGANVSVPVAEAILSLGAKSSSQSNDTLKIKDSSFESLYLNTQATAFSETTIETLAPDLKEMYLACINKAGSKILANLNQMPDANDEFVICLQWVPDPFAAPVPTITITDCEYDHSKVRALENINGNVLQQGNPLLLRFARTSKEEATISIATNNGSTVDIKLVRAKESFKSSMTSLLQKLEQVAVEDSFFTEMMNISNARTRIWPAIRYKNPQPAAELQANQAQLSRIRELNTDYLANMNSYHLVLASASRQVSELPSEGIALQKELTLHRLNQASAAIQAVKAIFMQPNSWRYNELHAQLQNAGVPQKDRLMSDFEELVSTLGE